jgi:CheY-like chemotaxis protein
LRVLVVDDDPDSRTLTATTLETAGARAVPADSVAAARTALAGGRFDALVADIAMPDEDGYDLIRHVRASTDTRQLPALAFTAYAGPEDRRRALDAGYDAHLAKPVDPVALVDALGAVVRKMGGPG